MKILIAYDGSDCANAALEDLRRAGLPDRASVRVITVAEHGATLGESAAIADQAVSRLRTSFPQWDTQGDARTGSPARSLVEAADEWRPDLLVVGSHGRTAFGRFLLGSVSHKLVAEARCSVRVARAPKSLLAPAPVKIIVATDGSEAAAAAVREVAARQWPDGSEVVVVTAADSQPPDGGGVEYHEHAAMQVAEWRTRRAAQAAATAAAAVELLGQSGLIASPLTATGSTQRLVGTKARDWGADCVFVGATGAGGADERSLGSAATHIVMHSPCTVEVVRAGGARRP
jgi:nucleotide-binding universal stress UspA family protein